MAANQARLKPAVAKQSAAAAAALKDLIRAHPAPSSSVRLRAEAPGGASEIAVPAEALLLFVEVLDQLGRGNLVTVAAKAGELSTQQAADLLNVSRPYLIRLLDDGKLPHRRVGNRRRVRIDDLLAYKRRDDAHRRKILAALTAQAQEMGLDY